MEPKEVGEDGGYLCVFTFLLVYEKIEEDIFGPI